MYFVFVCVFVFVSVFVYGICRKNRLMRNGFVLRQIKRNQITYQCIKFVSDSKAVDHICLLNIVFLTRHLFVEYWFSLPTVPRPAACWSTGGQKRALMVTISISSKKVVLMNGAHSTGG